jgi:hypothetical protein
VYLAALVRASLFGLLHRIDLDLAQAVRAADCGRCGGPLHWARWLRKPRGGPPLPEQLSIRHGLCCGHCRRRTLPPSVLFLGRKVYWGLVVVLVGALRQRRPASASARKLRDLLGVSWKTVCCWMHWWAEAFPSSPAWRAFRGHVDASVHDDDLPAGLLDTLPSLLRLRSLLTTWAHTEHAVRGVDPLTQKMGRSQLMR